MKTSKLLTALVIGSIVALASCKKENIVSETAQINGNTIPEQNTPIASVRLGFTRNYALLAFNNIINTGYSQVYGNVGLASLGECSGFPKGSIHGTLEINNEEAAIAMADLGKMYEDMSLRETADMVTLPADLSGINLTPGLYTASNISLNGTLTFNAKGDENAVFIIKVAHNLMLSDNAKIILKNNAKASSIFWNIGGSLIAGSSADIKGNMIVLNTISLGKDSFVEGRIFSLRGSIDINQNIISLPAVQ